MKTAKKALSVFLCALMLSLCLIPAFAEVDPATCTHTWYWITQKAPTCGDPGIKYEKCTLCGSTRNEGTEIEPTGNHTFEWVIDTQPTCGAAGSEHAYCTVCKKTYNAGTVIQPTGEHNWVWVIDTEPTCYTTGLKHQYCTVCENTQNMETLIPATGNHKWVATEDVTPATCKDPGAQGYKCNVEGCTATKTEPIPVKTADADHSWRQTEVDKSKKLDPTCAREGYEVYSCSVCGREKSVAIPATGAHTDANNDGVCDTCGVSVPRATSSGTTFMEVWNRITGFFWSIIQKIQALFTK